MLLIHGGADDFVPTYMSRENYDACIAEKELVIVEGRAARDSPLGRQRENGSGAFTLFEAKSAENRGSIYRMLMKTVCFSAILYDTIANKC